MKSKINKKILQIIAGVILITFLLGLILKEKLLYHAVIELASIIIAVNMFIIALRGYWISRNNFFNFLGISYGFVAFFDFLHFLSHPSLRIISGNAFNISAQLWLVSRGLEAFALLFSFYFFKQKKIKIWKIVSNYAVLSIFLLLVIMRTNLLPQVYYSIGAGTQFKLIFELIICAVIVTSAVILIKKRELFHKYNVKFLFLAMVLTIIAEIFFMGEIKANDFIHTWGHVFKAASFYLIYLAIIRKFTEEVNKLSQAVEQSPSTVVITNTNGEIEYVNPKFTEVTGYEYEEVKGKNPRILKSGYHCDEFYENLWRNINEGNEWRDEFYNRKKNGEYYWEDASISPIQDNDSNISHFLKVGEEITERKEYEKKTRRKESAIKSS